MSATAATARACGPCTLCCKVLAIEDIEKPAGAWCAHCVKGAGCGVYETRPDPCRAFACAWLKYETLPHALRPDISHVVLAFDSDATRLIAICDPAHPLAWRREPMFGQLKRWAEGNWAKGGQVVAMAGPRLWAITPDQPIDLGELEPNARFRIARRLDGGWEATVLPAA